MGLASVLAALWIASASAATAPAKQPADDPGLRSASVLVTDGNNGEVIYAREAERVMPIASITKLMTALVVIDGQQPLDEVIEITHADFWEGKGAFSRLPVGAKLTREELMKLALMASENRAARVLGRAYPGGIPAFVKTMNLKAKTLGMTQTRFDDPSGLSNASVSTARDLAKLLNAAARDTRLREYSTLQSLEVRINRTSTLVFHNTNLLVGKPDWEILVQKTGFTNDAGECLVMQARIDERPVNIVLLNSFGKLTRTADARRLRKWMQSQVQSSAMRAEKVARQ